MKKLLLAAIALVFIVSCQKTNNNGSGTGGNNNNGGGNNGNGNGNPTPTTTQFKGEFIPNWQSDTLRGDVLDSNNQYTGEIDSIITFSIKDTSFIEYEGKRYYIWVEALFDWNVSPFVPNDCLYTNIAISPTLDLNDAVSYATFNSAQPYRCLDQQGNWTYRSQQLLLNDWEHFKKVAFGFYD